MEMYDIEGSDLGEEELGIGHLLLSSAHVQVGGPARCMYGFGLFSWDKSIQAVAIRQDPSPQA